MSKTRGTLDDPIQWLREALRLHKAGRSGEARFLYEKVLRVDPGSAVALHGIGVLEHAAGNPARGVDFLRAAIARRPTARYHNNLANALRALGDHRPAEQEYFEAIRLDPSYVLAHYNLCVLLVESGRNVEAENCLRRGLATSPAAVELLFPLGELLRRDGRDHEAIACFERVIAIRPEAAEAFNNLGALYPLEGRLDAAQRALERAVQLAPDSPYSRFNLARLYDDLGRFDEALVAYEAALARTSPLALEIECHLAVLRRRLCDWSGEADQRAALVAQLEHALESPMSRSPAPLTLNVIELPGRLRLRVARHLAAGLERETAATRARCAFPTRRPRPDPARLRIGYVSPDFRIHAVGSLIHDLFRHHDRNRVEVFAYSLIAQDDPFQRSVRQGVDHFADVSRESPEAIARRIHTDGIDLLVDLAGYTTYSRSAIFALRPAPVQVHWLGYLDTQGSPAIPYALVDDVVVPDASGTDWSEVLVSLPDCFAVCSPLSIDTRPLCRPELGLPETGTVFCSMNALHKLDGRTFGRWMQIIARVPGAVLWLYDDTSARGRENLIREAAAHGIDSARMVFASRAPLPRYLARYRCADLFLDSFAYNAGATAAGALRAGLPVLTMPGANFMSRMGASLVMAAGLPDCVCASADDYEERAVELGRAPGALRDLRERLVQGQATARLFDLPRFARSLEAAFQAIWEHHERGGREQRIRISGTL